MDEALPALGDEAAVSEAYAAFGALAHVHLDYWSMRSFDRLRGALALRLDRVDEADAHYRTGLAWTERERCPVEQGRCLEGLAEVALRRVRTDEARQYFDQAAALFETHGAMFYLRRLEERRSAMAP